MATIKETQDAFSIADSEEPRYLEALGRLVLAWGDAEQALYQTLVHYAGVSAAVAGAIFSGTRARNASDFIDAISHNSGVTDIRRQDLEHVLPQLRAINTARDRLMHNSSDNYQFSHLDPKRRILTNHGRSSRIGKHFEDAVGADDILAMVQDLRAISNHLDAHHYKGRFRPWRENPEDRAPTTWLYKPQQPKGSAGKSPKGRPEQKARPKPSRG